MHFLKEISEQIHVVIRGSLESIHNCQITAFSWKNELVIAHSGWEKIWQER